MSWNPPQSPLGLVQEPYFGDEWKILIACQLLNMTKHVQVRRVLPVLFKRYPDAQSLASASETELANILRPLGFYNRRAKSLKRFSAEYLSKDWTEAIDLYGIGKYANDAWHIFCVGDWRNVSPDDHALNDYHDWLKESLDA